MLPNSNSNVAGKVAFVTGAVMSKVYVSLRRFQPQTRN